MNTLVVYESMYGSTRLVAQTIARAMRVTDDVHGSSRLRTRDAGIGAAWASQSVHDQNGTLGVMNHVLAHRTD